MPRTVRLVTRSLAVLLMAGAAAPIANAWPLQKVLHLHPGSTQTSESRITVHVFNQAHLFREVRVDGRVYTVMPNQGLAITAPVGTPVYAASKGFTHRKDDLLFTVTAETKDHTITID